MLNVMNRKQVQFDKTWKNNPGSIRQLAVNYYKLWTGSIAKTGYSYYIFAEPYYSQYKGLYQLSAEKYREKLNGRIPPYIKIWRGVFNDMVKILQYQNKGQI